MSAELLQGFYLGDFLIEPLKGQVTGRDGSTHLPPKAVEVLLCLARTPGELVGRETLLDEVWGVGHGSQEALSHAVSEIRHALGDHPDDPHFIQTLPKRGYRLIVPPELVSETTSSVVIGTDNGARTTDISFVENLKRRGVLETGIAYLVVGWLAIQVSDIVFERLNMDHIATFVTVLVIAGFPMALVLSWYLEFRAGRAVLHELSPADARRRRFSRTYVSVVSALGMAAVVVFIFDQFVGLPRPEITQSATTSAQVELPPIVENSFAVLPFLNVDGSQDTQIFANGLVDDLITRLSRVPGLKVASRGDSYALQPNSSSREVRERLRVAQYLEGSVQIIDDTMRVIVQLINSEDGFHILSRTFDRPREDFFKVRDEITSLAVGNIRVALPPEVRASSLKVVEDPSLDVWLLYRRGIETFRQPLSIDNIAVALGWFDAALEVDPDFPAAHAGKCGVYVDAYREVGDANYIERAEAACARALALNPNLDIVHRALGDLYLARGRLEDAKDAFNKALDLDPANVSALTGLGDTLLQQNRLDEAETVFRKAVDIHPGDATAFNALGTFLYRTGRFDEAAEQFELVVAFNPRNMNGYSNLGAAYMLAGNFAAAAPAYEKAIEIDPRRLAYSNLGMMQYYLGDFDAAIEAHRKAVELAPNDHLSHANLGDALWATGRLSEARDAYSQAESLVAKSLEVNPNDTLSMMDRAWLLAMLDRPDEARRLIDRVVKSMPDDPYSHYYDGLIHMKSGDVTSALRSLAIATKKGYSREMLAAEPHLKPLRDDSRFQAMIRG